MRLIIPKCLMAKLTYFRAYKVDIGIKNIILKLFIIRSLYSEGKKTSGHFGIMHQFFQKVLR